MLDRPSLLVPSLLFWFVPTWCGDFRLEAAGKDGKGSVLTVEDPTEKDRDKLAPFLATCKERGWMKRMPNIKLIGKTVVRLAVSVAEAGPALVTDVHPGEAVWTAVRFEKGTVEVVDGTGEKVLYDATGQAQAQDVDDTKAEEPKKRRGRPRKEPKERGSPTAAASVRAPRRGCPPPSPAARRASEVLRTFSTASQWESWQRTASMRLVGGTSGNSYLLFHRDVAHRKDMGHTLVDVRSGREICAWDDSVPAEEEALSLKLAVEHRERWLLSPHGRPRDLVGGGFV